MIAAETTSGLALASAAAGALALAFGGAPLGVLLIARRMSLVGDSLSHGVLPGAAIAFLIAGPDPLALTAGALVAGLTVVALSSLLARSRRLPEDAAFAVVYLSALAIGVLLLADDEADTLLHLLFGDPAALDASGLTLAVAAAAATLVSLALFLRGFVREASTPAAEVMAHRSSGVLHVLLMCLVALNLVAGFRAFGALMTVGLMMLPAAGARYWATGYVGQAVTAVAISAVSGGAGLILAAALDVEPGAVMVLSAAGLFLVSGAVGPVGGWFQRSADPTEDDPGT